jgi:hypothetical protein
VGEDGCIGVRMQAWTMLMGQSKGNMNVHKTSLIKTLARCCMLKHTVHTINTHHEVACWGL